MRGCEEDALATMASAVERLPPGGKLALIGGGAAALLTLVLLARRYAPFLVALYARLSRRDLIEHPKRAAALAAIRARPGVTTAALAREAGIHPKTLAHHLRALARGGLVKPLRAGRDVAWFEAGHQSEAPVPAARRAVLAAVAATPGATQTQVARQLGRAKATVNHHVRKLEGSGALAARREGRDTRLFALRPPG